MTDPEDSRALPHLPIPGSYHDRILEARSHMDRQEWAEAARLQEAIVERLLRLPEQRRRPGSNLASFLVMAAADLQEARAQLGDWQGATALCRQLTDWDADNRNYWLRHIEILHLERGEIDTGLDGLYALAESEPQALDHWLVFAQQSLAYERGERVEAALDRAEALAVAQGNREAQAEVAFTRFRWARWQRRWHEAVATWQATVALVPEFAGTAELVVRMLVEAGLLDEALEYCTEDHLHPLVATYYQAVIAYRRGDRVRGRNLWRWVAESEDDLDEELRAVRGMAYCWLGQPLNALDLLLGKINTKRALPLRYVLAVGLAWAMQGDVDSAKLYLALAANFLRQQGHPGQLSLLDRQDFDTLVTDETVKAALQPYFAAA